MAEMAHIQQVNYENLPYSSASY